MGVINDEHGVYTVGPGGEKQYAHATEFKMGNVIVYQMDETTGVLKICASPEDVQRLIQILGRLPVRELVLPSPLGQDMHFFNVQKIESIATKDGFFFICLD